MDAPPPYMTLYLVLQTYDFVVLTDGIGFNNIAAAMVSVIQILTYASWSYMMYRFTDTYGIYAIIYSVLCIIIGCYFVVSPITTSLPISASKRPKQLQWQLS